MIDILIEHFLINEHTALVMLLSAVLLSAQVMASSSDKARFQMRASSVFLTYPQCDVPKETALDRIKVKFAEELKYAIVAHELHESGDHHLHCFVAFTKQKSISRQDYFDFIAGKHGNYKPVRGAVAKTVEYTIKHGDYVEFNCDAKSLAKGKQRVLQQMCDEVKKGVDFIQLWDSYGASAMIQRRNLEWVIDLERRRRNESRLLSWSPTARAISPEVQAQQVAQWINQSIKNPQFKFRSKNLYVSGPPMIGKNFDADRAIEIFKDIPDPKRRRVLRVS